LCSLVMNGVSSPTLHFWKLFSPFSLPKLESKLVIAHMWHFSDFSEPFTDIGPQSYATVTVLQLVDCCHIHHSLVKSLYSLFLSIIQLDSSGLVLGHRNDGNYLAPLENHHNLISCEL
jgi:hypothetical protein